MEKKLHYTNGTKSADIEISLKDGNLSICGTVYKGKKLLKSERNLISCGQCLDETKGLIPAQLYEIWKRYHLNDLRAGTPAQQQALEEVKDTFNLSNWYNEACFYLESINLLIDNGYRYGTGWLREELSQDVIDYLESL